MVRVTHMVGALWEVGEQVGEQVGCAGAATVRPAGWTAVWAAVWAAVWLTGWVAGWEDLRNHQTRADTSSADCKKLQDMC